MCFHSSFSSFGLFMLVSKSLNTQRTSNAKKLKKYLLATFSKTELFS